MAKKQFLAWLLFYSSESTKIKIRMVADVEWNTHTDISWQTLRSENMGLYRLWVSTWLLSSLSLRAIGSLLPTAVSPDPLLSSKAVESIFSIDRQILRKNWWFSTMSDTKKSLLRNCTESEKIEKSVVPYPHPYACVKTKYPSA